jgi:hypothetical protein
VREGYESLMLCVRNVSNRGNVFIGEDRAGGQQVCELRGGDRV